MNEFDIHEEDLVMLESLIRSPAFSALKRCLENYRKECLGVLKSTNDTHKLFQTQGRLIGLDVIENLPAILVKSKQSKLEAAKKAENYKPNPNPAK